MKQFDSIICISQTPWQGNFQKAIVQLMTELSTRHRVLYVDYPYTLKDGVMGVLGRQPNVPLREMVNLRDPLTRKTLDNGGEAYIWVPPAILPINWMSADAHDWFIQWNINRLVSGIRQVMRRLNMQRPLVVNAFHPVLGLPMIGQLNECATLYYCFDEITAEAWMNRHGSRYEQQYLRKVDAVVTTSETLRRAKSALQPNAFCVKNGVNFALFNQAQQLIPLQPAGRPVVGYLGMSDSRINIDLVEFCVRTMPETDFQFIGEVVEAQVRERLSGYLNVQFTPPHRPAELPPLLAKLNAAMIPYVCNEHTYTIYPLKINEYLAAGLPVVSTPFSLLDDFEGVVELADTPERFAQALQRALADTSTQRVQQRVDMARANSWEERAREFEAVIRQLPAAWAQEQPV
ncbi:hypothetical protein GCM10023189_08630 [Nibrella saemangeumensis]|uniref:Uncharacterized protein n=1 Tax=Nibrella saemangeumensis TaxID=1084526 RepID=A0ABP8MGR9_9BACT